MYRVYSQAGGYKDFLLMSEANEWITDQQVELIDHGYQVFRVFNGELDVTRFGAGSLILLDPAVYECLASQCMEGFLLPPIGTLIEHARIATLRSVGGVVDFLYSGKEFRGVAIDGGLRIIRIAE